MNAWVALLRGINVGGNNLLPMKALQAELEALGATQVKTYIQSGNVVFQHAMEEAAPLAEQLTLAIQTRFGFAPRVLLLPQQPFLPALVNNPFPAAEAEPKTLHLWFLAEPAAAPNLERLRELQKESEAWHLTDRVFYLHAPEGIGRSKLAEQVEKCLGVPATARNWRTATKIRELLAERQ